MYKIYTDQEIAESDPSRHKEIMELTKEYEKREPFLYRKYPERYCLECTRLRQIPISRYCTMHFNLYNKKQKEDIRSGKAKHTDYAYTVAGFNEGMNAYVHDKYHWKQLAQRLRRTEQLENI